MKRVFDDDLRDIVSEEEQEKVIEKIKQENSSKIENSFKLTKNERMIKNLEELSEYSSDNYGKEERISQNSSNK